MVEAFNPGRERLKGRNRQLGDIYDTAVTRLDYWFVMHDEGGKGKEDLVISRIKQRIKNISSRKRENIQNGTWL